MPLTYPSSSPPSPAFAPPHRQYTAKGERIARAHEKSIPAPPSSRAARSASIASLFDSASLILIPLTTVPLRSFTGFLFFFRPPAAAAAAGADADARPEAPPPLFFISFAFTPSILEDLPAPTISTLPLDVREAGCVDEYLLYMAPMLIGDTGRGLVHLPGANRLADARPLEIIAVEPVGSDWRIRARPAAADNRN